MRKGRLANLENEEKSDNDLNKGVKIVTSYKEKLKKQREQRKINIKKINKPQETKIRSAVVGIIFSIIILILCLFVYFGPFMGIGLNRDTTIEDAKKIDIASSDFEKFDTYCSDLLIYSNQKIATYNSRGEKNWEYELSSQFNPSIYIKNRFMAITNNSNGKIYLFENKKEILNTKIDGNIDELFLDENGNYVVEYSTSGYKKVLGVYNKKGKNLYNAYMSADSLLDVRIMQNAKQLLVFQINTSTFKTGIDICLIDSMNTNQIKTIATIDNNLIYSLTIQNRNIIMLLDDKIVKCNIDTGALSDLYSFDVSQLMYISLSNNYYCTVSKKLNSNSDKNEYVISSNRFDNTNISSFDINESPKMMKNSGVINYFIYQNKLQLVNKWGIEVKKLSLPFPPKDIIIFNNSRSVALIYTNKVYITNI